MFVSTADSSKNGTFSLENKAIKSRFNIIAGVVSNLYKYKSTEPSKKMNLERKASQLIFMEACLGEPSKSKT
jgi:hypothetical protein